VADEKAANEPVAGKYQGQSTETEKRDKVMRGEIVIMSSAELDAWIESADGMPLNIQSNTSAY
jgi:heme/copper-type cytochrome/quinol oxidase subunit 2